jgi:SAM-dependent methyltransferase
MHVSADAATTESRTSGYDDRLAQEKRRFDAELHVHDLPGIFHYWSNTHLRPFINGFGYDSIDDFFVQEIARTPRREGQPLSIASVGSGDCATEIGIAAALVASGATDFRMLCLDISDAALQRGRAYARDAGLPEHFEMAIHDINQGLPEGRFDVVMANQSLHHVVELERLYATIRGQLAPDGCFLVSDMIGRNGHMRWPEARDLVDAAWESLPDRYRFNWLLQCQERQFMDWDCSQEGFEGIRAQEVLPLLLEYFSPRIFLAWGNIIDVFVDRAFGHNFHDRTEWDLRFIDRIHAIDSQAIADGTITPTHLLARFQNEPGECACPPGMTPQAAVRLPREDDPAPRPRPSPRPLPLALPLPLPRALKDALRRVPGLVPLYRRLRGLD